MPLSPVDRRLAARCHQSQLALIRRTDRICAQIAGCYARLAAMLFAAATADNAIVGLRAAVHSAVSQADAEVKHVMESQFPALIRQQWQDARDNLLATIPQKWWRVLVRPRVTESMQEDVFQERETDPLRYFYELPEAPESLTPEEYKEAVARTLFPPLSSAKVDSILTSPGYGGLTWTERFRRYNTADQDSIHRQLQEGISTGETNAALRKRISTIVDGPRYKAERIARTEGTRVAAAGGRAAEAGLIDMTDGWQRIAVLDQASRPEHAAKNGEIYYYNGRGNPESDQSYVSRDGEVFPGDHYAPNCILPGMLASGQFHAGFRAVYSGKIVQCRTSSKRTLACTANHRVLTTRGWIVACKLQHGDELVCDSRIVPRHGGVVPISESTNNENNEPLPIEEVFEAIRQFGAMSIVRAAAVDFHGDERFLKSDVEIVRANRELLFGLNTESTQGTDNSSFERRDVKLLGVTSSGASKLPRHGIDTPPTGDVSSFDLPSNGGGVLLDSLPFQQLSFGPTADWHVSFPELISDGITANADFVRNMLERFSGQIATDRIVNIKHLGYEGHVFDLSTRVGWYSCNGIITHNCRCDHTLVLKTPAEFNNDPRVKAEFITAQKANIPDPSAYTDWWQNTAEKNRQQAVGIRRYQIVDDRLSDGQRPEWTDFIREDGSLVPIKTLKAETHEAWQERKLAVTAMLAERERLYREVVGKGFVAPPRPVLGVRVGTVPNKPSPRKIDRKAVKKRLAAARKAAREKQKQRKAKAAK